MVGLQVSKTNAFSVKNYSSIFQLLIVLLFLFLKHTIPTTSRMVETLSRQFFVFLMFFRHY